MVAHYELSKSENVYTNIIVRFHLTRNVFIKRLGHTHFKINF